MVANGVVSTGFEILGPRVAVPGSRESMSRTVVPAASASGAGDVAGRLVMDGGVPTDATLGSCSREVGTTSTRLIRTVESVVPCDDPSDAVLGTGVGMAGDANEGPMVSAEMVASVVRSILIGVILSFVCL